MFAFTRKFTETPDFQTGRFILCPLIKNNPIVRHPSKWTVSYDEIPASDPDVYPDYCCGRVTILTPETAAAIVEAVQQIKFPKFLWIEDVWVTGYLADYLNITKQVLKNT